MINLKYSQLSTEKLAKIPTPSAIPLTLLSQQKCRLQHQKQQKKFN